MTEPVEKKLLPGRPLSEGPRYQKGKKPRGLDDMLEVLVQGIWVGGSRAPCTKRNRAPHAGFRYELRD